MQQNASQSNPQVALPDSSTVHICRQREAQYQRVHDERKRPIRGLWVRNGRYYAQLTLEDEHTGQKKVRRVPLEEASTPAQARQKLEDLRVNRRKGKLPVLKKTPKFSEFANLAVGVGTDCPAGRLRVAGRITHPAINQIYELEVATHQKLHGNRIPCCFEDVCEPTRIPIRVNERVNRNTAAASRNSRGGGKTMTLKLIEVKDLPQAGKQLGNLVDLVMAAGKNEDGQEFKDLVLTGDLDATDKAGKKYRVEKRYNLLGRGLGI